MRIGLGVLGVLVLGISGCEFLEEDTMEVDDYLDEYGFAIEIVEARFLEPSMGENRLYIQAKLTNESEPRDLVMATHRLWVDTDEAGRLSSGFHDSLAPEDIELCPQNNNGRAVPRGSSFTCGFVVESESDFTPERLVYWSTSNGSGLNPEDQFDSDIPSER